MVIKRTGSKGRARISRNDLSYTGIEINQPAKDLLGYTFFIYGAPKIGKTTAALSWPSPIVLACETRGIKAFKVPHIKIRNWEHLEKAYASLAKESSISKYKTVIIDTVDLFYKYCLDHCCDKFGFDHPSDQNWGKGWEKVSDTLLAQILKFFDLGYTIIFISHSKSTEIRADFEEYTRIDPTVSSVGRKIILPIVDVILYMKAKENSTGNCRYVTTKAVREYEAGDRTQRLTDLELKIPVDKRNKVFEILNKKFLSVEKE